jgi:hypothetical protein
LPIWNCTNTGTVMVIKIGWTRASFNRTPASASGVAANTGPDRAGVPGAVLALTPDPAAAPPP